jgi:hypothetical protein
MGKPGKAGAILPIIPPIIKQNPKINKTYSINYVFLNFKLNINE